MKLPKINLSKYKCILGKLADRLQQSYDRYNDERSRTQFINIIQSTVFKGGAVVCNFLVVPLTINYLNVESYGIWVAIYSFVTWMSFLDGGLGNGLKNKLSESIAKEKLADSQRYISSAYMGISFICLLFILIFIFVADYIDWYRVLNIEKGKIQSLKLIIYTVFIAFCFRLILELLNSILLALQKTGLSNMISFITNFGILVGTFFLTRFVYYDKLLYLSIVVSLIPILVLAIFTIYVFKYNVFLKNIKPSLTFVDTKAFKEIYHLGLQFFIIQIAVLIIFSTDNYIILHWFGSTDVTVYNTAFKYFSIITVIWSIVLAPYWAAFNSAFVKNDFAWIHKSMRLLFRIWGVVVFSTIGLLVFSNFAYKVWIGDAFTVPFALSLAMSIFILVSTFNSILAIFINGLGIIRIQFIGSIFAGLMNIPLSYFFAKVLNCGTSGIMLGTIFSILPGSFIIFIQYKKIITQKDTGIWSK